MGIYYDYLTQHMTFEQIVIERRKMLNKISTIRENRDILVIAADLVKPNIPNQIDYTDVLPVTDLLSDLKSNAIDIILETPGGFAEVVEDIVRILRGQYEKIGIIIPGYAKSAGTIFTMAGDEILMGETSALGPIDGQIMFNGKRFSADAFLNGLKDIQDEVIRAGRLNPAYIPILQNISPGEIQHCKHVQDFARNLVTKWLENYKFKYWENHTDGRPVTKKERHKRARQIGKQLSSQSKWFTHARSIRLEDLENIRVKITDYSKNPNLNDAIIRYYTLLRMTFESTGIYKIFETKDKEIYRFAGQPQVTPAQQAAKSLGIDLTCPKCKGAFKLQVNLEKGIPAQPNTVQYPISNDLLKCPHCGYQNNVSGLRLQIEAETGKKVV